MSKWKIALIQMDCKIGDTAANLAHMRDKLREAAGNGARLVAFPECALSGYCFQNKAEAMPFAETVPGPSCDVLAGDCRALGLSVIVGLLEHRPEDDALFNTAVLLGPNGVQATYRKIHLPFLGIDRFTTPGDIPFAVHEIEGVRIGMCICYDGSFPETARILSLLGADAVVLITNWPTGALTTVKYIAQARALENTVYFAACNRVGSERGFEFIGRSRVIDVNGELIATSDDALPAVLYADIDPQRARKKKIVNIAGQYELDRLADRRPDMYGPLVE